MKLGSRPWLLRTLTGILAACRARRPAACAVCRTRRVAPGGLCPSGVLRGRGDAFPTITDTRLGSRLHEVTYISVYYRVRLVKKEKQRQSVWRVQALLASSPARPPPLPAAAEQTGATPGPAPLRGVPALRPGLSAATGLVSRGGRAARCRCLSAPRRSGTTATQAADAKMNEHFSTTA